MVSIAPPDTTVAVGDEFVVRIETDAGADLKGFRLIFPFDPSRLQWVSATEGDVLTSPGGAYAAFVIPDVTAPVDTFAYDAVMLDGATQGPGILVFARFRAIAPGSASIACGEVEFRDSFNESTTPDCAGATVHIRTPDVRISQIYGGGGEPGATLRNDYVELFNADSVTVDVTGWTVQYAAGGAVWQATTLAGTIPPGGYYLVQEAQGAGGTADLPTPDAVGTIDLDAATGKVALVTGAAPLADVCPSDTSIADLVGYGAADCAETAPAPALGDALAGFRAYGGCQDTDDNAADFASAPPAPRSSASPLESCRFTLTASTHPPSGGTVAKSPDQATYALGEDVTLTAMPGPGYVFVEWGGDAAGSTNPIVVQMNGDRDVVARFATDVSAHPLVISQVYGGGGEAGADWKNDFVELFNRGDAPVDVSGWTVQHAPPGDTIWSATPLTGIVPPGRYYLVAGAGAGGGTLDLPAPDATGAADLGATGGQVALVSAGAPLSGACPGDPAIEDLLGYGPAGCAETAPAPGPDVSTAAHRLEDGCVDTDDNSADFELIAPAPRNSASPLHLCAYWVDVDPSLTPGGLALAIAPNPSRGPSRVRFALPRAGPVRLRVFDLQGRIVATLADGELPAGLHAAEWRGVTPAGPARSGIYFVRLQAAGLTLQRTLVLRR